MASQNATMAHRRLLRDLKEYNDLKDTLPTVAAAPTEHDILTWHVSLTAPEGPYSERGTVFHMVMTFKETYPEEPPIVKLCTELPHPNVYAGYDFNQHAERAGGGYYICLNMLRPQEGAGGGSYSGWSGAYSVYSLLMQLSSFLFAEQIDQVGFGPSALQCHASTIYQVNTKNSVALSETMMRPNCTSRTTVGPRTRGRG
jgi:ubiquitin-protein ligase